MKRASKKAFDLAPRKFRSGGNFIVDQGIKRKDQRHGSSAREKRVQGKGKEAYPTNSGSRLLDTEKANAGKLAVMKPEHFHGKRSISLLSVNRRSRGVTRAGKNEIKNHLCEWGGEGKKKNQTRN